MSRIVHISDLHFGREDPELVTALTDLIERLGPDLVAVSGDLTQRARRAELKAAAAFTERLAAPVLVVPGNHDLPGITPRRFIDPWRRWRRYFPGTREPCLEREGFIALGANSARSWGPYRDWSRGRLNAEQVDRLAKRFQRAASTRHANAASRRLRILVAHHPFLLSEAGRHRGLIGGAQLALSRLSAAGLDLALGGHLHLSYAGLEAGIVVAHAGTAVSRRLVGEPNAFNTIDGDGNALEITHWAWTRAGTDAGFSPVRRSRFRRGPAGWQQAP
jgi:3',5'-cyclic AMP phosphodiesterase CpdA